MEQFFKEFITLYGPLGFGWIGFAYMLYTNNKLQAILLGVIEKNTKAMSDLETWLKTTLE